MNTPQILAQLDALLHESHLEEALELLRTAIDTARTEQDLPALRLLCNELIGFYRDTGAHTLAVQTAEETRRLFEDAGETESTAYATTLLNCANAYRAAGQFAASLAAYEKARAVLEKNVSPDDMLMASYYNNIALLYQEQADWVSAIAALEHALSIAEANQNDQRIAISRTNLAVCLNQNGEGARAQRLLEQAAAYFEGLSPSDFHASAALAAQGDLALSGERYAEAVQAYEAALAEIDLHMGQNDFYQRVEEKAFYAYEKLWGRAERPPLRGAELAERFYHAFVRPMLRRNFPEISAQTAVVHMGEGSECLGYDDALSQDHDFSADLLILVPDTLDDAAADALAQAYARLPKCYCGIRRRISPQAAQRFGVMRWGAFLEQILGQPHLPENEAQWLSVPESGLAILARGQILAGTKWLDQALRRIRAGYPEEVRLRRLAQALGRAGQCGQYNLPRMRRRGDTLAAQFYLTEFIRQCALALHLTQRVYAPYEKWLYRSMAELAHTGDLPQRLHSLYTIEDETALEREINEIAAGLGRLAAPDTEQKEVWLMDIAEQCAAQAQAIEARRDRIMQIARAEFQAFDEVQNIGGRAACQDDWETFSIMRYSQYAPWTDEMLRLWADEFEAARAAGRNLIMEKYARMMESTDPALYAEFRDQLPPLSEEFVRIREGIIAIQIPWMESFAQTYPHLAARSRTIHTAEDSPYETSYETYLRGELSQYSIDLLVLYGRFVVDLHRQGQNLTALTMTETVHAYGYDSLEAAEADLLSP